MAYPKVTNFRIKCPYCGGYAFLRYTSHHIYGKDRGPVYDCRPCDAYVGVHRNSRSRFIPKGTPADEKTRYWRVQSHTLFDRTWKAGEMTRTEAYQWLSEQMGEKDAHIGTADLGKCKRIVRLLVTLQAS